MSQPEQGDCSAQRRGIGCVADNDVAIAAQRAKLERRDCAGIALNKKSPRLRAFLDALDSLSRSQTDVARLIGHFYTSHELLTTARWN